MTYIADLTNMTVPGDGYDYLWVGWLGSVVPRTGQIDVTVIARLRGFQERNQLRDGTLGLHTCEICGGDSGHGSFFVEDSPTRYVLPNLVFHYISAHQYRLPDVVEDVVRRG